MKRGLFRSLGAVTTLLFVAVLVGCGPVEGEPPDMADVEAHLDVVVGFVPVGCDPLGLDGDGRGKMFGAGFDCPDASMLRIERFDAEVGDEPLPDSPSVASPGRVEWRDAPTGDVIRVVSNDLDLQVLLRVGESIEVHD